MTVGLFVCLCVWICRGFSPGFGTPAYGTPGYPGIANDKKDTSQKKPRSKSLLFACACVRACLRAGVCVCVCVCVHACVCACMKTDASQ